VPSEKIHMIGVAFTGHFEDVNYDIILIEGASDLITISDCSFAFYTRYGVSITADNARVTILGNTFNERTSYGDAPIHIGTAR
jgi:hypothetical protein